MVKPFTDMDDHGNVIIERGQVVTFDGFMTALYEREINHIVPNAKLYLELEIAGNFRVGLYHRSQAGQVTEFATQKFLVEKGGPDSRTVRLDFDIIGAEARIGRWYFSIEALDFYSTAQSAVTNGEALQHQMYRMAWNAMDGAANPLRDVILKRACWGIYDAALQEIRPCFVICTFKREEQLAANIDRLVSALAPHCPGYGIVVVDNAGTVQNRPEWPDNVRLIAQRNVGGAGGFGRGIFEALEGGTYTHIVMLDDDADVEPTAITRLINLFRLSRDPDVFIGGAQLDVYNPVLLADGGAHWVPDRFERPFARLPPTDLGELEAKDALMRNHNLNFNGWWLFGGHVDGFRKFGMPLPCFVHLDDVDYGVRLSMRGGQVLSVPGIAVWHEPYYAKPEGWFAYYNIRNELIRLSCHTEILYALLLGDDFATRQAAVEKRIRSQMRRVTRLLLRRFRGFSDIYHYGSAMLLAIAIEDFLKGPDILERTDAADLHARVMKVYKEFSVNHTFSTRLPVGVIPTPPGTSDKFIVPWVSGTNRGRSLLTRAYNLYQQASHNGNITLRAKRPSPMQILSARKRQMTVFNSRNDINWRDIRAGRDWAYYDPQKIGYHIFSNDPSLYHQARTRLARALRQFQKEIVVVQPQWAARYDTLTSEPFWRELVRTFDI
ncbi:glycosyltransferase [Gluconacetobacter azotocaptans DSM 13594]|nr:glycosyltransferase [Gluconacetobacter azotocaptans DSM 13594]